MENLKEFLMKVHKPVCPLLVILNFGGGVLKPVVFKPARDTLVTNRSSMSIGDWYFPAHDLYLSRQCSGPKKNTNFNLERCVWLFERN